MNDLGPAFTNIVSGLPSTIPFVGPEAIERRRGQPFQLRVGANESAFGISPSAAEAMRAEANRIAWYGDPEGFELREEIARFHSVSMDEVCLAGGIDELLGLTVRMFVEPGTPVLTSLGAYPTFNYQVSGFGGELLRVPYRNDHIDLDALASVATRAEPALVFFANPDNPMGTWHDAKAVQGLMDALPRKTILILDEAYIEFAPDGVSPPVDTSNPRLLRMRTFSKAHGMAGVRVGYVIAHRDLISGYNRIRNHFGVNRFALAGALASLRDPAFIRSVVAAVDQGRRDYYAMAQSLGLAYIPSATNFVSIDVGGGDRARAILAGLESRGVFVRMPAVEPMDRCVRVSVGRPEERVIFREMFEQVLAELQG
jgi:histidinol-phosphate aminotransferase